MPPGAAPPIHTDGDLLVDGEGRPAQVQAVVVVDGAVPAVPQYVTRRRGHHQLIANTRDARQPRVQTRLKRLPTHVTRVSGIPDPSETPAGTRHTRQPRVQTRLKRLPVHVMS